MMKIIRRGKLIKEAILYVSWFAQNELGLRRHIFARFYKLTLFGILAKLDEWSDKLVVSYETMILHIARFLSI